MPSTTTRTDRVNDDGTYWCDCEALCKGELTQLSSRSKWYRHRPKKDSTRKRMAQEKIIHAEHVHQVKEIRFARRRKVLDRDRGALGEEIHYTMPDMVSNSPPSIDNGL